MRKFKNNRILIFTIIILLSVFAVISCNLFKPWKPVIEGVGIFGKSSYGTGVFGQENR